MKFLNEIQWMNEIQETDVSIWFNVKIHGTIPSNLWYYLKET